MGLFLTNMLPFPNNYLTMRWNDAGPCTEQNPIRSSGEAQPGLFDSGRGACGVGGGRLCGIRA